MKLALVLLVLGIGLARAEPPASDPMPTEEPSADADAEDGDASEAHDADDADGAKDAPDAEPETDADADADREETPPAKPARQVPRRARMTNPNTRSAYPRVRDDGQSRLDKTEDTVLGGKHWRIKTAQGAVHVWVPPDYDRATAGTVVYVHGYWTDVDRAWKEYSLARQFRKSRQNALFIVPEAPANREQSVRWPALTDLRRAVTRANIRLPDGPIIVMGHSGAFRTVMQWVDHKLVDQIILLDAMYAGEHAFDEYIKTGKHADWHKLIVVGNDVAQHSASFAARYKFARAREKVPDAVSGFTKAERRAKLLYIHSQYDHYAMIRNEKVIPLLLRLTKLKRL